jgi:hypothetical protein
MKRAVLIVLALAGLVAVAFFLLRGGSRDSPAKAAEVKSEAAEPIADTETLRPGSAPATAVATTSPGKPRVLVPRPTQATTPRTPRAPRVPRLERGGEMVDRREGPREPDAEEQRVALGAAMEAVEDDIEECLRAWSEVDPEIHGRVSLAFELDDKGLGKVWVQDHQEVPQGPMTCFASAIYGVDWSNITQKPIEISNHFVIADGETQEVELRGPPAPKP